MPVPPPAEPTGSSLEEIAARLKDEEADASPARRAAQAKHEQEVLQTAAGVTAESAVKGIGALKVTIDAALDRPSQQLVDQAKQLAAALSRVSEIALHQAKGRKIVVDIWCFKVTCGQLMAPSRRHRDFDDVVLHGVPAVAGSC